MRAFHKIVVLSLSVTLLSFPTFGQNLELAGKLVSAIKETNDAVTILDSVHTAATNALAGQPVTAGSDWYKLAVKFKVAAEDTKAVPLPSELVFSEPVAVSELTHCSTRNDALEKLTSYLTNLRTAQSSGQNSIQSLDDELKKISAAKDALAYLVRVHEQLIKVPIYGDLFVNSWIDLNTTVGESLGDLNSAYTDLNKRYTKSVATLTQEITNLESNIDLFLPCTPAGTWSGSGSDGSFRVANSVPPYCYGTYARKNVTISITVEQNGGVSVGAVKFDETSSYGPPQNCDPSLLKMNALGGSTPFTYKLKFGATSGATITATFEWSANNTAIFTGHISGGRLNGELVFSDPNNDHTTHQIK